MVSTTIQKSEAKTATAGTSTDLETRLAAMDHQADLVIAKWSGGALAANLLPPPFDLLAVSATFVRMGQRLARVYEVRITARELRPLAKAMVKGVTGVELAAHLGTDVFKYVPGVNVAVALLIQPPIVAAIAYSVGTAFKRYYRVLHTEGRALTPEELQKLATDALRKRIG
jgi:uncharacterized protein (DUF697 family)